MFCSWTHCLISLSGVIRHNYFLHLLVLVLKLDNGIYHYLFSFFDLCSREVSVIFLDVVAPLLPSYSSCMFFKTTKTTFSIAYKGCGAFPGNASHNLHFKLSKIL